jgi:hypothetical protein
LWQNTVLEQFHLTLNIIPFNFQDLLAQISFGQAGLLKWAQVPAISSKCAEDAPQTFFGPFFSSPA